MRSLRFFIYISTILVLPGALSARVQFLEGANTYLSCSEGGSEASFRVRGSFYLHAGLFEETQKLMGASALQDAIAQELRFIQGYFVNQKDLSARVVMKLSVAPQIESAKIQKVSYPFSINVDAIAHPDVKPSHPYLLAALQRASLKKGDPGLKVTFQAVVKGLHCGEKAALQDKVLSLELPSEPYLAYYLLPSIERRKISWHLSEFVINPCAEAEYADIPDPYYYWYFWKPKNAGVDATGKPFDCRRSLGLIGATTKVTAKAVHLQTSSAEELQFQLPKELQQRSLRVTALIGAVDLKGARIDYTDLLQRLAKAKRDQVLDVLDSAEFLQASSKRDPGSRNVLQFIAQSIGLLDDKTWKMKANPSEQILILEGLLKRSQQATRIQVFFGDTDVLTTASPLYWKHLTKAVQEDDVVLYSGHSGLGENLKLASLLEKSGQSPSDFFAKAPKSQIIGYFSCYSYSYFGEEMAQARQQVGKDFSTDLIRTASAYTSAKGLIVVLDRIDGQLASSGTHPISSSFRSQDRILVTSFSADTGLRQPAHQEVKE